MFVHACAYHPLAVVSHGHDELGLFSHQFCAVVVVLVVRSGGLANANFAPQGKRHTAANCILRLVVDTTLVIVFAVQISA